MCLFLFHSNILTLNYNTVNLLVPSEYICKAYSLKIAYLGYNHKYRIVS